MTKWRATIRTRLGSLNLDVDLASDGGALALLGPNGSGKTTLLRAMAGAFEPDQAEIAIAGCVLQSTERGIFRPIEQRRVGYVPQGYGLFPHLDVLGNVAFGLTTGPSRLDRRRAAADARRLLMDLGCAELAPRRIDELSGGERQRVALARALVLEPELLLLDEPLAALDPTTRRGVRCFLAERLRAFGRPSVVVTHDVRDIEALDARVVVMEAGRVLQQGTLAELRMAPASDLVAELVGTRG